MQELINHFRWSAVFAVICGLIGVGIHFTAAESLDFALLGFITTVCAQHYFEAGRASRDVDEKMKSLKHAISFTDAHRELVQLPTLSAKLGVLISDSAAAMKKLQNGSEEIKGIPLLYEQKICHELDMCRSVVQALGHGSIRASAEESRLIWIGLMQNLQTSYLTTNLFKDPQSYGRSPNKLFLGYQEQTVKRLNPGMFRRVFIYEDEKELEALRDLMKLQHEIGIKVAAISAAEYKALGEEIFSQKIGCSDFSLVDDAYVYTFGESNALQRKKYVELTSDKQRVTAARDFFRIIEEAIDDAWMT